MLPTTPNCEFPHKPGYPLRFVFANSDPPQVRQRARLLGAQRHHRQRGSIRAICGLCDNSSLRISMAENGHVGYNGSDGGVTAGIRCHTIQCSIYANGRQAYRDDKLLGSDHVVRDTRICL